MPSASGYYAGMTTVTGWDATHANLHLVPPGQGAGYTTGTDDVRWTEDDWAAHPGSVRICQDAGATDDTADVLDVETGAATIADAPGWVERAMLSLSRNRRPGQRWPTIYIQVSRIPQLREVLVAANLGNHCFLYQARWGVGRAFADLEVALSKEPPKTVAFQYENAGPYDNDIWSKAWLDQVATAVPDPGPAKPPTWLEHVMEDLPTLKQGDKGDTVRTAQGLLVARGYHLGPTGTHAVGVDGDFGPVTDSAVRDAQQKAHMAPDGVIGPETWPVLLGV